MNPIKPTLKTEILAVAVIIITIVASFYFYFNFPARVPTHWNLAGQPDGWSGRGVGAFLFPVIILGVYLMFLILPVLDPKQKNYLHFAKTYHLIKNLLVLFLAGLYFVASFNGLGYSLPINIFVPSGVGLLLIILGYCLPRLKPNWFIGIRTPWTLSNETVWQKTHQFGSKIFMLGGLILILGVFLPGVVFGPIFILAILILALAPIVYSYWLYRKEKK